MTSYEQYMSIKEAMQRLKKSDATIRRYIRNGAIRYRSDRQRRVYLLREDVERIAYEDSLLSPPAADREPGQEARIAELEQTVYDLQLQIEELRARIEDLTELVKEPSALIPAPAPVQKPVVGRYEPSYAVSLPGGLVPFRIFTHRHGLSESTVKGAIDRGEIEATSGEWKIKNSRVKRAFDLDQQRAFLAHYRTRRTYHPCLVEECPCHE